MCILKMRDSGFSVGEYSSRKSHAEFDLVYQPSQRWKVAPIQQRLSKERTSLIFLFLLLCVITGFTFHFVSLSSVTICHNCFIFVYRVFYEVLKHSVVQKWNSTCCKLASTWTHKVMHHLFSSHLIIVLFLPEPSLCNSFRLALFTTLDWDVSPSYTLSYVSIRCFRSLHCIPLKFLECFLKCHEEFSWASILQSFRDTSSIWGSWVQVFSTVRTVSCTEMENIQAIIASIPV